MSVENDGFFTESEEDPFDIKRNSGTELEGYGTILGDDPIEEESNCFGRCWKQWIRPNLLRGFCAAASITSTIWLSIFAQRQFVQDEFNHTTSMGYGAGLGLSATVLTGSILPPDPGAALADWVARWSYEGLQALTEFYLNAGCPISGNGLWDTEKVPPAVKELAMILFTGVSASIALLSLRTLLFPKASREPLVINDVNDDGVMAYKQHPDPILMLESGKNDMKWFIGEQVTKAAIGVGLITLQLTNVLASPEWFYLGAYLAGHVGGIFLGKAYQIVADKIREHCPVRSNWIDTTDKIGRIVRIASYGICFGWANKGSFAVLGLIGGVAKMVAMHKFELLEQNNEKGKSYSLMRIDNVIKGGFVGLFLAWYICGMMDKGLQVQDYANIVTYLATTLMSYPFTRYLASSFVPRENNRLFSTLRFYFVDHNQVLILPYMLVRSAQSIGE